MACSPGLRRNRARSAGRRALAAIGAFAIAALASCVPPPATDFDRGAVVTLSHYGRSTWPAYGLATYPTWGIGAGDVGMSIAVDSFAVGVSTLVLPPIGGIGASAPTPPPSPVPREWLTPIPASE
jgi:hypothetical protein